MLNRFGVGLHNSTTQKLDVIRVGVLRYYKKKLY